MAYLIGIDLHVCFEIQCRSRVIRVEALPPETIRPKIVVPKMIALAKTRRLVGQALLFPVDLEWFRWTVKRQKHASITLLAQDLR
jgi:hypothetical protein